MCSFHQGKVKKALLKRVMMPVPYLTIQFVGDAGWVCNRNGEGRLSKSVHRWVEVTKGCDQPQKGWNVAAVFLVKRFLTLPWMLPTVQT